jgi:GAF domain-containing protein
VQTPHAQLRDIFARDGLRAAVIHLNRRTNHRFTAVLQFGPAMLNSICFYDRDHPETTSCDDIPEEASYCVLVKRRKAPLVIGNAPEDPRVVDHPARQQVQAYCGFPLTDDEGTVIGTLCHFDVQPRPVDHDPLDLMRVLADLLHPRGRAVG